MKRAQFAALAVLDEDAPLGSGTVRWCARPRCRRPARPAGRYCRPCASEATQRWRDADRSTINARRRDRAGQRDEGERRRDSARAQLAVYVQRGRVTRGRCSVCGTRTNVGAYQPDLKRPLEAVWLCPDDRAAGIAAEHRRRDSDAFAVRREAAVSAFARLPAADQQRLRDAACLVKGVRISAEAPLARMTLIMRVERHLATLASQGPADADRKEPAGGAPCSSATVESDRGTPSGLRPPPPGTHR